jgi:hypothetical protein
MKRAIDLKVGDTVRHGDGSTQTVRHITIEETVEGLFGGPWVTAAYWDGFPFRTYDPTDMVEVVDDVEVAVRGFRHVRSLTWPPRADRMGRDETVVFVRHTVASAVPDINQLWAQPDYTLGEMS